MAPCPRRLPYRAGAVATRSRLWDHRCRLWLDARYPAPDITASRGQDGKCACQHKACRRDLCWMALATDVAVDGPPEIAVDHVPHAVATSSTTRSPPPIHSRRPSLGALPLIIGASSDAPCQRSPCKVVIQPVAVQPAAPELVGFDLRQGWLEADGRRSKARLGGGTRSGRCCCAARPEPTWRPRRGLQDRA